MIFVDTNVLMYAVGGVHPLRDDARRFFERQLERQTLLVTSSEVLQELLHAYLPVNRLSRLELALELVSTTVREVWSLEAEDVYLARSLIHRHPGLGARDLIHLATCRRRNAQQLKTYDRALQAAFDA